MQQSGQHLLSANVFLDTEAYVRSRFNFTGGQLSRLSDLVQSGTLRLLTTSITKREVARHLERRVRETIEATRKDLHILTQSGAPIDALPHADEAVHKALHSFHQFLHRARAIEVPLEADLEQLFIDYFALTPPFAEKKPNEFPDAVVAASLRAWCLRSKESIYIVSGDKDFDGVAAALPYLHKAESLAEVLSHASVSKELQDNLTAALRNSADLDRRLGEDIVGFRAETTHATRFYASSPISAEGTVTAARIDKISSVNVVEGNPPNYVCAVKFTAEIDVRANIVDRAEVRWPAFHTDSLTMTQEFMAEVRVLFSGDKLEITSTIVDEEMINLDEQLNHF